MTSLKLIRIVLFCFLLSILFVGDPCCCLAVDKLNIVTTTTNLASIAEAVGGDYVSVTSIGSGNEDPHFIQAKPSFMMKAKKADLWICIGMELEIGYEGLILQGSRNPRIQINAPGHLDVSEGILKLEVPTGKIDRSMGDVHPLGNPHYWLDPYNGRIIATNICRRLKQLDSDHAADYDRNLAAFLLKLDSAMFGSKLTQAIGGQRLWQLQLNGDLDKFIEDYNKKIRQTDTGAKDSLLSLEGWLAKLKPFEHAKIAIYHRSWPYFTQRFKLDEAAELELKPGIPPGPAHILEVINIIKAENVKVILMEPFYNRDDAEAVASKTAAKVIVVPNAVTNEKDSDNYIAMLDNIVTRLSSAFNEVSK
jgi:zinc/manganese transport system substrate-binding protein